jgi:hypothetical protein
VMIVRAHSLIFARLAASMAADTDAHFVEGAPMTETEDRGRQRRIAARKEFADEVGDCTPLEAFDRLRQRREDNWNAVNKALYGLTVAHGAGLVACMTLLKDYAASGPLKGVGRSFGCSGLASSWP